MSLGDELLWLCPSIDDSPNDISGNGNNGTYRNGMGTVADSDPTYGGTRAYSFDGTDDFIDDVGPLATWDFVNQTGVFTLSVWAKSDVSDGNNRQIIGTDTSTAKIGFGLWEAGNTGFSHGNRFDMTKGTFGTYQAQIGDSDKASFTSWRCLIAVGDGTNLKLYVNGVLVGTDPIVLPVTGPQFRPLHVGSFLGSSNFYDGLMDDIRIYDRDITQEEITYLSSSRGVGGPSGGGLLLLGVG